MTNVISLTKNAVFQLKKIISDAPQGTKGVLLGIDKSGCSGYSYKISLTNNENISNYELIEKDDVKVFIDPKAIIFLVGSEMDYKVDKLSSRFVFNNPNQKNTCGCGESFSL